MDNFAEQLVKNQPTGAEKLKRAVFIMLGIILTFLAAAYGLLALQRGIITFLMLIVAAAIGIGTFFYHKNTKIEYEYTFTNGELDIDKIINQTKRKEMLTVSVSKFTAFGKYTNEIPEETSDMTTVFATDNIVEHEFYADFQHESYGNTRLIFVPNEKMLSNIVKFLHPTLKNKVKREIESAYLSDIADNI